MKKRNRIMRIGDWRGTQGGFSLIEFVLVMTILSTLSIGVLMFMNPIMDLMVHKNFHEGQAKEARLALVRMMREITQIRDVSSVTAAQSDSFGFTDVNNQAVTYALANGTLTRNNIPMARNIATLQFTYWDVNHNTLVNPTLNPTTDIWRVEVSLTVLGSGESATFRSQSQPRNFSV